MEVVQNEISLKKNISVDSDIIMIDQKDLLQESPKNKSKNGKKPKKVQKQKKQSDEDFVELEVNKKNFIEDRKKRIEQQEEIESDGEQQQQNQVKKPKKKELQSQQQQDEISLMKSYFEASTISKEKKQSEMIKCQILKSEYVSSSLLGFGYQEFEIITTIYRQDPSLKKKVSGKEDENQLQQQISNSSSKIGKNKYKDFLQQERRVKRRYRDFDLISAYLSYKYSGIWTSLYQLPEKSEFKWYFQNWNTNKVFMDERIEGLKMFVNENGNNETISNDEYFRQFINYYGQDPCITSDQLALNIQASLDDQKKQIPGAINDMTSKARSFLSEKFNVILSLGFVQYMDDYDCVLDIKKQKNYPEIRNLKERIESYLLLVDKLDQNVRRSIREVQDLQKHIDKQKMDFQKHLEKDAQIFSNSTDLLQSKQYGLIKDDQEQIDKMKDQQDLNDQSISVKIIELVQKKGIQESIEEGYAKIQSKINKCKGTLESSLNGYNKHFSDIEQLGENYKIELEDFLNKNSNLDNMNNQQQDENLGKIQRMQQNLEYDDLISYLEILDRGKKEIEEKSQNFEKELRNKMLKQTIYQKFSKLLQKFQKIQGELAKELVQINTDI